MLREVTSTDDEQENAQDQGWGRAIRPPDGLAPSKATEHHQSAGSCVTSDTFLSEERMQPVVDVSVGPDRERCHEVCFSIAESQKNALVIRDVSSIQSRIQSPKAVRSYATGRKAVASTRLSSSSFAR